MRTPISRRAILALAAAALAASAQEDRTNQHNVERIDQYIVKTVLCTVQPDLKFSDLDAEQYTNKKLEQRVKEQKREERQRAIQKARHQQ